MIIAILIIGTISYFQNPRLLDRAIYRIGIQEQICFPKDIKDDFSTATNIAAVGDIATNKNSLKTLKNLDSSNPEIILFLGDLSYGTADEWIEFTKFLH